MTEKWYDGLDEDAFLSDEDRKYKAAIKQIVDAVKSGIGFDEACELITVGDDELKTAIKEDAMKVIIAEMHFVQKMPIEKVALILKISVERVNAARESMLREIGESAIKSLHRSPWVGET